MVVAVTLNVGILHRPSNYTATNNLDNNSEELSS